MLQRNICISDQVYLGSPELLHFDIRGRLHTDNNAKRKKQREENLCFLLWE